MGSGNQDRPERTFTHGESDRRSVAAGFEFSGLHAESLVCLGIKAPAAIESRIVDRLADFFLYHTPFLAFKFGLFWQSVDAPTRRIFLTVSITYQEPPCSAEFASYARGREVKYGNR
jgi:hypothetical protein